MASGASIFLVVGIVALIGAMGAFAFVLGLRVAA